LGTEMNEVPGQALGSNKMAFPTEAAARAYVKTVSDEQGIAQLDGGETYLQNGDRVRDANGRPLGNSEVEAVLKRAQRAADALQNNKTIKSGGRTLSQADLQARVDAAKGISKAWYVGFQPKVLQMFDTQAEATRARNEWLEQYPTNFEMTEPRDVMRYGGRQNEQFVGQMMDSLIRRMRASDTYQGLNPAMQADLTRPLTFAVE